jgi:hypothetical protein
MYTACGSTTKLSCFWPCMRMVGGSRCRSRRDEASARSPSRRSAAAAAGLGTSARLPCAGAGGTTQVVTGASAYERVAESRVALVEEWKRESRRATPSLTRRLSTAATVLSRAAAVDGASSIFTSTLPNFCSMLVMTAASAGIPHSSARAACRSACFARLKSITES